MAKKSGNFYDTVIVGSGFAGASTAYHLISENNYKGKVLMLEARDRIGGRAYGQMIAGKHIELGCNWIHGLVNNPVYDLAIKYKLVDPSKDKPDEAYEWNIAGFTHEGEKVSKSLIDSVHKKFSEIQEKANQVYKRIHKGELVEEAPFGQLVDEEVRRYLLTQSEAERPLLKAIFNQWIVRETDITGCNSLNDLSLNYYGLYTEIPGGNLVIPKPGYGQVVQCLIDEARQKANGQFELLLKHEVIKIKWHGSKANTKGPIEVTCANGAVFQCSHLVNTMPVGVLKAKVQTLYEPSLPQHKVDSINALNFDCMNKFFLEFEKPLFPDYFDSSINEIMTFFKLPEEVEKEVKSQTNLEKHWVKKICSFLRLNDRLLLAFISGEEAKYAEKLDQAVLIREITGLLRSMLRNPAFPEPSRIVQTTWGSDPFTRGCYTNVRVGASLKDIQQLEQPVFSGSEKPALLFAGEGTHSNYFSTTHGAVLSGKKAASYLK